MLWAITSFFNPAGYKSRLANYQIFRARLKVPLLAVELSFTGAFELRDDDADILIQISGGDVMWQKERLLNIALGALPLECDIVAWLDCDIILASDEWPARAREALKSAAIVQLFSERLNLMEGFCNDSSGASAIDLKVLGVAYKFAMGTLQPGDLSLPGSLPAGRCTNGLAWASSRCLMETHGFYDVRIIGSGDKAMACAALGKFADAEQAASMNARQREHYRAWGNRFFADVRGRVGYVEGRVFHLWHGDTRDRQYRVRHQNLNRFEFDPYCDIAFDSNRVWRWNSDKPALHQFMREFFGSRREDGDPTAAQETSGEFRTPAR